MCLTLADWVSGLSVVDRVKQVLIGIRSDLPVTVAEFEKALNRVGCTMYDGSRVVFDHGNYVSDVVGNTIYTVTWYDIAWLGLSCNGHKLVAVFRNLVTVEMYASLHMVAYYDLFNVVESDKLYSIVENKVVARTVSERVLKKLVENGAKSF